MAVQQQQQGAARRRGKERVSAGLGLSILGGVVALLVTICLFRLVLLLVATSGPDPNTMIHLASGSISESPEVPEIIRGTSGDIREVELDRLIEKVPEGGMESEGAEGTETDNISEDMRVEKVLLKKKSKGGMQKETSRRDVDGVQKETSRRDVDGVQKLRDDNASRAYMRVEENTTTHRFRAKEDNGPYHSRRLFFQDYSEMVKKLKVFIYPCAEDHPLRHIFLPLASDPGGNYASESYFKKAMVESGMVTSDPSEADFFFMPFSITRLRTDSGIGVGRIQEFIENYVNNLVHEWPYWNRTGGSDHFYAVCHSIGRTALDRVQAAKYNVIQVVCSANYYVQGFIPHKDVSMPQIWPRDDNSSSITSIKQRNTLAFYAGGANSPVRKEVVKAWKDDKSMRVFGSRIKSSYGEAHLNSKFCLHIKGFEVNTARLADALYYGCVPVIIANYYELPFDNVLNWSKFSVIVTTGDIPKLKAILSQISSEEYKKMHSTALQARRHFQWHSPPQEYDTFYMVMYQLWLRRHIVRYSLH